MNDSDYSWESVRCNWCNEQGTELLFQGADLLLGLPGKFQLVRCVNCGLFRQNPRLVWADLQNFYNEDYCVYDRLIETEQSSIMRFVRRHGMNKRFHLIEKYKKGGKLLDVGCGTGLFLAEAKNRGHWEISGLEPNEGACEYARQMLNVPILNNTLEEAYLHDSTYDVITMWNVLEHLGYPVDGIKKAYKVLKKGGLLIFSIPNLEGIEASLFKEYWVGWDLPRHLYLFPNHVLKKILVEIGFELIDESCVAGNHGSSSISLEFLLRAKGIPSKLFLEAYRSLPMRGLALIPFWVVDRLNQCALITIVARK